MALLNLLGMIDGKAPLSSETAAAVVSELQAENAKLRSEVEPLRAEIADLQKQMSQLRASMGVPQTKRAGQPVEQPAPSPPLPPNVVSFAEHSAAEAIPGMGMLVEANRAWSGSPYVPIDPDDKRDYGRPK
jgi:hypothetical protein